LTPPARPPVLALHGVCRTYVRGPERLEVLRGIDLELRPGEIVGLLGPSGSGKSSLLHAAGLLERPTAGSVEIGGRDCGRQPDAVRSRVRLQRIGFVYQMPHLLPELTALENVALPHQIGGACRREAEAKAAALLADLGLAARTQHRPAQLSGGEQQRVAIARALVNDPIAILADEPTGNLDPDTSLVVLESFLALIRHREAAGLIATHDQELARRLDRVVRLRDGRLAQTPDAACA
jgi:lipoprotein-releasing system ATP-binding protein